MTAFAEFKWVLYVMSSLRGVGTSFEVKHLRYPSGKITQSRLRFLGWNIIVVICQYLIIDFMTSRPDQSVEDKLRLFGPGTEYLFFRPRHLPPVSAEDLLVHLGVALSGWGPIGKFFIDIDYRVMSLVSVFLGISTPDQWPLLFGSITETYTLRGFWG
jgi:hypothetical protein